MPDLAADDAPPLTCQRCTWLRRKALFQAVDALGCNVVAFAHHADDAAQTTLLNLLYGGDVRTLAPCADYFDGRFRLIRPLIYVPESDLKRFARASGFPPATASLPALGLSRRRRVAEMLKLLGRDYLTQARTNLIRAGLRATTSDERRMTKKSRPLNQTFVLRHWSFVVTTELASSCLNRGRGLNRKAQSRRLEDYLGSLGVIRGSLFRLVRRPQGVSI